MTETPELRRCKILCTLGPATRSPEVVTKLLESGINAVRINFSHGSHDDHAETYEMVRNCAAQQGRAIAILADLQGPKIRVGELPQQGIELVQGETLVYSADPAAKVGPATEATPARVTIDYPQLLEEARPGDPILMDDGALEAVVESVSGQELHAKVITGGTLFSRKGVNLPKTALSLPSLTDKDERDLEFALELGVDMVALSFVRRPKDVQACIDHMVKCGRRVPVVAKIEKPEAIPNLDAIVEISDGLMVARGDLGVEMGPEEVPLIQKQIIERCNAGGKLVVTATQMLDSMIRHPRPTRAEASDVANAVLDGSDAVMLSGETAVGKYPLRVVETMDRIVRRIERAPRIWEEPPGDMGFGHGPNAIARSAVASSRSLHETRAIVVYTGSGGTARLISDYRPQVPIFALTPNPHTYQSLALYWGVVPVLFSPTSQGGESIFTDLDRTLLDRGLLQPGDRVVMVMGYPLKAKRSANLLKLHVVGETLRPTEQQSAANQSSPGWQSTT